MEYASIDFSIDTVVAFIFVLCIAVEIIVESVKADRRFKKQWNDGICPDTGKPWEEFDTDSSGAVGYRSEDENGNQYTIWV